MLVYWIIITTPRHFIQLLKNGTLTILGSHHPCFVHTVCEKKGILNLVKSY